MPNNSLKKLELQLTEVQKVIVVVGSIVGATIYALKLLRKI